MNVKSKKLIIVIVLSMMIISSITYFIQFFKSSDNQYGNETISKQSNKDVSNNHNYKSSYNIVLNLTYVEEYISKYVIQKQRLLKLLILGGRFNKNDKNSKKYKESELGWISNNIRRVNRYAYQTKATIDNSNESLKSENKLISKIINIIKEHPYTYEEYLDINKYIIPSISFFMNVDNFINPKHLKPEIKNIFNNTYNIINNNSDLNCIAENIDNETLSVRKLSLGGSSLAKVTLNKVTFCAKIITFNSSTNSYKYAVPTSNDTINDLSKNKKLLKKINLNRDTFTYLNKEILTKTTTLYDNIPWNTIIKYDIGYLPKYFNTHISVVARSTVKYNKIIQYKKNKLLYSLIIISPFISTSILTILKLYILRLYSKYFEKNYITRTSLKNIISQPEENFIIIQRDNESVEYFESKILIVRNSIINIWKISSTKELKSKVYKIGIDLKNLKEEINSRYWSDDKACAILISTIEDCSKYLNQISEVSHSEIMSKDKKNFKIFDDEISELNEKLAEYSKKESVEEVHILHFIINSEISDLSARVDGAKFYSELHNKLISTINFAIGKNRKARDKRIKEINELFIQEIPYDVKSVTHQSFEEHSKVYSCIYLSKRENVTALDDEVIHQGAGAIGPLRISENLQDILLLNPSDDSEQKILETRTSEVNDRHILDKDKNFQCIENGINYLHKNINDELRGANSLESLQIWSDTISSDIFALYSHIQKIIIPEDSEQNIKHQMASLTRAYERSRLCSYSILTLDSHNVHRDAFNSKSGNICGASDNPSFVELPYIKERDRHEWTRLKNQRTKLKNETTTSTFTSIWNKDEIKECDAQINEHESKIFLHFEEDTNPFKLRFV